MIRVIIALLLTLVTANAFACGRCGLFGNRCKFSSHVAVAPLVVKQPEVFVVQNNYPQPNGAALLAQQGSAVYGLQGAAQAYTLDPAAVLRQAADLARGAQQLAKDGVDGFNSSASLAMQLNASTNDALAKGTAAALVLQAAGLNQPSTTSQAIKLSKDASGKWQVNNTQPPAQLNTSSMLTKKCGTCHGLDKAEPAGSLYLDGSQKMDCKSALKAIKMVMSGEMPKDKSQKLTAEELTTVIEELTVLGSP